MEVSENLSKIRKSEDELIDKINTFSDSGAGVIHVRTSEVWRAVAAIRNAVLVSECSYRQWDVVNGLRTYSISDINKEPNPEPLTVQLMDAIAVPMTTVHELPHDGTSVDYQYFLYTNPQHWVENNPMFEYYVQQYSSILAQTNVRVILVTNDMALPEHLEEIVATVRFSTPSHSDLRECLDAVLEGVVVVNEEEDGEGSIELSDTDKDTICYSAAGMSQGTFEMYASLSIIESSVDASSTNVNSLVNGISAGKTEMVNKNDILELYPTTSMEEVGGMENLKKWIRKRSHCFSDEAKAFGISPPKGIVTVGISGTGKSLIAKSIASELGIPLVRLDFGRVFNSLVGSSEARMRTALQMIDDMAPIVVLCVAGHTKILLSDGSETSIENLYEVVSQGAVVYLRGVDPNTGATAPMRMSGVRRSKPSSMYRIGTGIGSIEVTANHRLLVNRKGANVWVEAQHLQIGDDLAEIEND